jgi:DmsE family decaheme c-type cytochrome
MGFVLLVGTTTMSVTAAEIACQTCHLAEHSEPIGAMLTTAHWNENNSDTPAAKEGCRSCHGQSTRHAGAPTKFQPDVSFGPRWSSAIEVQTQSCLGCHEQTTHRDWRGGLHAQENLTCVTCHDAHTREDAVRQAASQANVCTVCHKVQKDGMHHLPDRLSDNPPCALCHNPHADPLPTVMMLANRSEGCRTCHDLQQIAADTTVPARAKSYHKAMQSKDRTCIDCHKGVAHVDADDFAAVLAGGFTSHAVTLFYPGQSDREWLLTEHPGAQSLRQGRNCRQCHIGEAANMGETLAPAGITPTLDVDLEFARSGNDMEVTVSWQGEPNANDVAVMFDDGSVAEFARGGCWASCHNDMPGMTRDRGQGLEKYLRVARAQERSVGRPAINHDAATLERMKADGQYVELWKAELASGGLSALKVYRILEKREAVADLPVSASANYTGGRWTVTFRRAVTDSVKPLVAGQVYTLGVAVHGDGKSGPEHWISLPLTVSLDGFDTDFVAR